MTEAETDRVVLDALREVAKGSTKGRIKGKSVQLAGPKDGDSFYIRIAVVMAEKEVALKLDLFSHACELQKSLRRLTNRELIFNNGGSTDTLSYWVVEK